MKPLKDKEDKLADEIVAALYEAKQTTAKRGSFRVLLQSVAGRVSWKDAWQNLKAVAEKLGAKVDEPKAPKGSRLVVELIDTPPAEQA